MNSHSNKGSKANNIFLPSSTEHTEILKQSQCKSYFVDEAGDPNLYDRHHEKIIVGTDGCSRFMILGMLDVADPIALSEDMEALRQQLCGDPHYPTVPGPNHRQRDTARLFHAKNDHPRVREQVFALLLRHDIRFFAVVTDKLVTHEFHRRKSMTDPSHSYTFNAEYEFLVQCLFANRLHQGELYNIYFANRGMKDHARILKDTLQKEREWYTDHHKIQTGPCTLKVVCKSSSQYAGLQATDYMLWALQKFYERGESEFLSLMWPKCSLINDRDLTGKNKSGRYFKRADPLSLADLLKARGI